MLSIVILNSRPFDPSPCELQIINNVGAVAVIGPELVRTAPSALGRSILDYHMPVDAAPRLWQ